MSKFNFERVKQNLEQVKKELPVLLANDAQIFFLQSFKNQGWDGKPWKEVKRRQEGTPEYKYPKLRGLSRRTNPILQGMGTSSRLRREVSLLSANARVSYNQYNFTVVLRLNDSIVPYAKYHNAGDGKIPQRKFMGDSLALRRILRRRIDIYLDKVWKTAA